MRTFVGVSALCVLAGACAPYVAPAQPEPAAVPLAVSTSWLADRLDDDGVVVLHVARTDSAFLAGHVPGARFVRFGSVVVERDGIPNELPQNAALREVFEAAGVSDDSHVVIYGELDGLAAGRTFFTLDYLGHRRVSLLDGGLEQWRAEQRAVASQPTTVQRGSLSLRPNPARVVSADWVRDRIDDPAFVIIDARPPAQYTGEDATGLRPGHIPGARNLFWRNALVGANDLRLRPEAELRALFAAAGARDDRTLVVYCRTGVQASHAYFVARLLGYRVVMYDGSYIEWSGRTELPVAR